MEAMEDVNEVKRRRQISKVLWLIMGYNLIQATTKLQDFGST
jgi:hypothetical protein